MGRRRMPSRRKWPPNLYCDDGYFYFVNPATGKKKGLGRDQGFATSEAREANKVLAKQKSTLARWVIGGDALTLSDWLPIYKRIWIERASPAESTITAAQRYFKRFEASDLGPLPLPDITTVHVARYLDRIAEESGPGAAMNMRARLLDVLSYAITKGHIETGKNPVEATIPPTYAPKRDRLSLEQFLAIRGKASPWLVNAMNLALLTGQRVSDISILRFVDVRGGFLHIEPKKLRGQVRLKLDTRIGLEAVKLTIADVIKQSRDDIVSPFMVHHVRTSGTYKAGAQVSQEGISSAFSDLRDELGIKGAEGKTPPTFHEIRSLAERLYRKERGKEFAQQILGHKSETMTAKYDDLRGSAWQEIGA